MKKLLFAALTLLLLAPAAQAGDSALVIKESAHGVTETLDRLEGILKEKKITVFARIDHAEGAMKVGAELQPTQLLIFGNPKLGTPLMQSNPAIGIDLPLKALAWKDGAGKVWLAYNDPAYLARKHSISDRDKVFATMSGVLKNLTDAAVAR